jgi:hypothetical protein
MLINNNKKGRFIFVDPNLTYATGDFASLIKSIVSELKNSGYDVIIFSNQSSDKISDMMSTRVVSVFSMTSLEYHKLQNHKKNLPLIKRLRIAASLRLPESFKITLRKTRQKLINILDASGNAIPLTGELNRDMHSELLSAMLKYGVTKTDHVFIYPADAVIYRQILQLLQQRYPLGEYPCFHICTPYNADAIPCNDNGIPVRKVISYLRIMGLLNQYIFLYAENELLADSLTRDWAVDVRFLVSHELSSINIDQLFDCKNRIKHPPTLENEDEVQESFHNPDLEESGLSEEAGLAGQGDTCHENKYNEVFNITTTSKSRNLLFIKQLS